MGRRAVVTGAASGIGRACADALVAEGCEVWSLDVTAPPPGAEARWLVADVADAGQVADAVARLADEAGGSLDVLVGCAGVGARGTVEDATAADWDRVLGVNVRGLATVTAACLPLLRRGDRPSVVNVSSIAAWTGVAERAVYAASKGAVHALTLAMAVDCLADGVRVNAVAPGTVATPWVERLLEQAADPGAEQQRLRERQPVGRLVTAEEVAAAVAYLAGPASASTTGTVVAVDGGAHTLLRPSQPVPERTFA